VSGERPASSRGPQWPSTILQDLPAAFHARGF
jgi:hypothetical protein